MVKHKLREVVPSSIKNCRNTTKHWRIRTKPICTCDVYNHKAIEVQLWLPKKVPFSQRSILVPAPIT